MTRRILVTGGTGCIGSATVRALFAGGADEIVVTSSTGRPGSLSLWLDPTQEPRLRLTTLDVGEADDVQRVVAEVRPTHVVHLGALQTPDCDAHPERGMRVNVGGTLHLLAAAEKLGTVERFTFASSAAVYGLRSEYPGATVRETDALTPPNLYGAWKLASEQLCRQFAGRTGIPTVSLRLNTTYGPGRDRGKTSAVTRAMKEVAAAAVHGDTVRFRMPYGGRENYHYVEDVAAQFAAVTLDAFEGYAAFNIRGETVPVTEFLDRIAMAAGAHGVVADLAIESDAPPNPFVCDLDDSSIQSRFDGLPRTALETGIERTLQTFVSLARRGDLPLD